MNTKKTTTNQPERRLETCADCLFCMRDIIPDPNAPHIPGHEKPKVSGYRCHAKLPTASGFPIVRADEFCALWTDKTTRKQPLARLLNPFYIYTAGEVATDGK